MKEELVYMIAKPLERIATALESIAADLVVDKTLEGAFSKVTEENLSKGLDQLIDSAPDEAPKQKEQYTLSDRVMSLHHPNLQPQWQGKHGVVTRVDAENHEIRVKLDECGTGCIFDMDHVVRSASKKPLPPTPTEQPNERTTD